MGHILIVDDDRTNGPALAMLLEHAGHEASWVPGAAEAIGFLKHDRPDLMMLDVMMPGMSGIELLRALRSQPSLAHLPVVIWSATIDQTVLTEAELLGSLDFFVKSRSDWPQLRERLEVHLGRAAGGGRVVE